VQSSTQHPATTEENTARLRAQLAQKNAQLAAIRDISRAIAEAQDLNDTLDLITRRTTEIMNVDSCSIYLFNDTRDKLMLAASTGLNQEGIGRYYIPAGTGLTGWAAENRVTVAQAEALADPRFYRILGSGESRFSSLMSTPLVSRDKVIGAANIQTENRHVFTQEEKELFNFITELAATALEKAQLVHAALVQEMHHRVKNNLQTIAMLLRLQVGQNKEITPQDILNETINRILSIATVHQILSEAVVDHINLIDLIQRIATTISSNMVNPAANVAITVDGDEVQLPSQRATSLALIANELMQNALEHGVADQTGATIQVKVVQERKRLSLRVTDDGVGLPAEFNPDTDLGLGLTIVRTSVTEDLQGKFFIGPVSNGRGTTVRIGIPWRVLLKQ
jgi:two-component sensor histidine kinase